MASALQGWRVEWCEFIFDLRFGFSNGGNEERIYWESQISQPIERKPACWYDGPVSYTYTYLVPLNPEPKRAEYIRRVTDFLLRKQIVGELESVLGQKGFFGVGDSALEPFKPREDSEPGFASCVVFIYPQITIVPEDPTPLEPRCPDYLADVSQPLNKLYCPDEETQLEQIDFGGAKVTCPECRGSFRPDELRDERGEGIFLTDRYVCFTDAGDFRPEWLAEFSEAAGTPHRVVSYWYT